MTSNKNKEKNQEDNKLYCFANKTSESITKKYIFLKNEKSLQIYFDVCIDHFIQ